MTPYPPTPEDQYLWPPELDRCSLADLNAVVDAVHYALRFNAIGKVRSKTERESPSATAERVVAHLVRCHYVVLKSPGVAQHSAG
ncbi:hypothetical protein E4L95_17795 [Paracoccus liaowanqingii]|uniref:Uncharacterized protein n=1 Tax=Paracoccus liaowanqingii TaxID=2560053 RepID=A0A4Z1C9V7_9RHOB|nr:hypothetical protein [Paracoccus liaowanqingii]TGN50056.1 hypothetical protein E4L95_17795 [Paracoccus liaowanqingii]